MNVEQLTLFDIPAQPVQKTACLAVGDFARILASKGFNIGEVRLFDRLRKWKMIDKFNVPYQEQIRKGNLKVIKQPYQAGSLRMVHIKVLVTPNGQKYIEERLKNEADGNRS